MKNRDRVFNGKLYKWYGRISPYTKAKETAKLMRVDGRLVRLVRQGKGKGTDIYFRERK